MYLSIYLTINLCVYQSMCLSIYVSINLCIYRYIWLLIFVSINLSSYQSICLSIQLSVYATICLSIFLYNNLSLHIYLINPTYVLVNEDYFGFPHPNQRHGRLRAAGGHLDLHRLSPAGGIHQSSVASGWKKWYNKFENKQM